MQWFPVGPDFVFAPVDAGYTRLSPSNEAGASGRVLSVAMDASADPLHPSVLYAIGGEGPSTPVGSTSVFRKAAADASWSCPGDALLAAHPYVDPSCVATHPTFADHAYVGTWQDQAMYVYDGATGTWGGRRPVPGRVRKLIVDPRPVATIANTVVYAATDSGVYLSQNNGGSWTQVLSGDVWSLAAHIPASGAPRFYAGLATSGVWFADTYPTGPTSWTNLPIAPAGFHTVLVDFCAANPDCAYAWFGNDSGFDSLYSTLAPRTSWSLRNGSITAPDASYPGGHRPLQQWQTFENFNFAVAPDSPGDGSNDVLFFGSVLYARSSNSGATWTLFDDLFHADVHWLAFAPGSPPAFHVGCDGGLAVYANATLASFDPGHAVSADDRSTRDSVAPLTATYRSGNRGLSTSCAYAVAQDPAGLTQLYCGCVDSGVAFRDGGLGWRLWAAGDAFKVAVSRAVDGVRIRQEVFGGIGVGGKMQLGTHSESGGVSGAAFPVGDTGGSVISTSNYVVDDSGNCLAGGFLGATVTTTSSTVAAASATVTIPVMSTAGISNGASIAFANDAGQHYPVSNVTASSFDIGVLYHDLPAGTAVRLLQLCAFRNALDRSTQRISQLFTPNTVRNSVTAFARGAGKLACTTYDTTSASAALWIVDESLTTSGPATWTEVSLPAGAPAVASLLVVSGGDVEVLFQHPFAASGSAPATPLYRLPAGGSAISAETCTSLPAPTLPGGAPAPFGKAVNDPVRPGVAYAVAGADVHQLTLDTSGGGRTWHWQQVGTGLPGVWVTDLAVSNVAPSGATPKVILRAAADGRGIWEIDVSSGATPLAHDLYVRRHLLDEGWTRDLRDGLLHPTRPGEQVWHWECEDIKIDRLTSASATQQYFQTDPDASGVAFTDPTVPAGPITSIHFDNDQFEMLDDFGQAVPSGHRVRVHVQVQNRSATAADGVAVWALWTHFSGQLAALNVNDDLTTFDFWGQFHADGTIVDGLPSNSRWKAVGAPVVVGGLRADRPQIASWNWDAPPSAGHYCIAVFVHSQASPIGETTNVSLDDVVVHNKQIGQKNLQVIDITGAMHLKEISLNFSNPLDIALEHDLVIDVSRLPKGATVGLHLAERISFEAVRVQGAELYGSSARPDHPFDTHRLHPGFGELLLAKPAETLRVPGVRLEARETVRVRMLVHADPKDMWASRNRMHVFQVVGGRVVGGSTIELRIHGRPRQDDAGIKPPPDDE